MAYRVLFFVLLIFSFLILFAPNTYAYYTYMPASVVVGQTNFTDSGQGALQNKLSNVLRGVFVDPNGRLIVSDYGNNRVLIWNQVPTTNGKAADLVLGQADFSSVSANRGGTLNSNTLNNPAGIYSDGTRLFIADHTNGRVLIWNSFPTSNGQAADVVVGKSSMTDSTTSCDSTHFNAPYSVTVYQGKMIISDRSHNRVLIFNSIPTTNGAAANIAIAQSDLGTCTAQTLSDKSLSDPRGMVVDPNGRVIVADRGRQRVMIWNQLPTSNFTAADVVVGQINFTSSGASVSSSRFGSLLAVYSDGDRLYVSDGSSGGGQRFLIWNQVPTTNGKEADLVLGQTNFTNSTANAGGSTSSQSLSAPMFAYTKNDKLFLLDENNARLLIYNNVISNPGISISTPIDKIGMGKLKIKGNVMVGEVGKYSLQKIQMSINGEGFGDVNFSGGRDDGSSQTRYEFEKEFEPWANSNGNYDDWKSNLDAMQWIRGYTVSIKATSFNNDSSSAFYFLPFSLNKFKDGSFLTFDFSVNKYQIQKIKDNIDHFEIWIKKENQDWTKYQENISTNLIDLSTGEVHLVRTNNLVSGKYEIKIKAISKNSNWQQDSNVFKVSVSGVIANNPLNLPIDQNLPIQINSITGVNSGPISSFDFLSIKQSYSAQNKEPKISGITYANSKVTLTVTNQIDKKTRVYTTIAKPDSSFVIYPNLFAKSTIDLSVQSLETNRFNLLPSFSLILK